MKQLKNPKANQSGFTLIEIVAVIIILGILVAFFAPSIGGRTEDTKVSTSNLMLKSSFPQAIGRQYARTLDCSTITKSDLVSRGLNSETPFGDAWTVVNTDVNSVQISFPTNSANDPSDAGSDINSVLQQAVADGVNSINATSFSSPVLTVTYQCR